MSVISDFGVSGNSPSTIGGAGITTLAYFPRLLGPSLSSQPSTPSATNATGQLVVPAANLLNGVPFKVVASGAIFSAGSAAQTFVALYANIGTVNSPNYVALTSTNGNSFSFTQNARVGWSLEVTLFGESAINPNDPSFVLQGGKCGGYYFIVSAGTPSALGASGSLPGATTVLTGINFKAPAPNSTSGPSQGAAFGLVVGVNFPSTSATNFASLNAFRIVGVGD